MGAFSVKIQLPEQALAELSPEANLGPQADEVIKVAMRVLFDRLMQDTVTSLTKKAKEYAPIRTGALRESIKSLREPGGDWKIEAGAPYSEFVEFGCFTRKHTQILTLRGFIKLSDVKVGDLVLTHLGRWKKVLKKHVYNMPKDIPIYKIKLKNGRELCITHNHPLYVLRDGSYVWVEAQNLLITDQVAGLKAR